MQIFTVVYMNYSTVICSEKNIHYLTLKCNSEFCDIENWINQNQLSLDYKTNCVLFSKTSKNESAELKIAINSGFIQTSSVVKYLGDSSFLD